MSQCRSASAITRGLAFATGGSSQQPRRCPATTQTWRFVPRYWNEKGLSVIIATRALNLAALAFTIAVSGFLLLLFDWSALRSACLREDTCDMSDVAVFRDPLAHVTAAGALFKGTFLAIFSLYWLYMAATAAVEIRCASAHVLIR
jgi:hypothetical protein